MTTFLRLTAMAALLAVPLCAAANFNPNPYKCENIVIVINGNDRSDKPSPGKDLDVIKVEPPLSQFSGTCKVKLDIGAVPLGSATIVSIRLQSDSDKACFVPVTGQISTPYSGVLTIPREMITPNTTKWKVIVQTTSNTPAESGSDDKSCEKPFTIDIGGCSACSGEGGICPGSASNGCFTYDMPLGRSDAGDTAGSLRFYTPDMSFPGLEGISVFVPTTVTVVRTLANPILLHSATNPLTKITITTSTTTIVAEPVAGNPNAITVSYKSTPTAVAFRTATISKVTDGGVTYLRADSLFDGTTARYQQKKVGSTYTLQSGSFSSSIPYATLREEDLTITPDTANDTEVHHAIVRENDVPVSDIKTTWRNYPWGWEKIGEVIDPNTGGANLTSTWSYYSAGEGTGPPNTGDAGSYEGYGRLKTHVRYDGFVETRYYWPNNDTTLLPFLDNAQGLTVSRQWNGNHTILTTTRTAAGKTISMAISNETSLTKTNTTYSGSGKALTTTTTLIPNGEVFGGQPKQIVHTDGTLTTYKYQLQSGGGKTVTIKNGKVTSPEVNGGNVEHGTTTTTTYNAHGTPILGNSTLTVPDHGTITTESFQVTRLDDYGRPEIISYFPTGTNTYAWTTTTAYNCCGIGSTTDREGVTTTYGYDGLRRRISSTTNGVTTETIYLYSVISLKIILAKWDGTGKIAAMNPLPAA